MTCVECQECLHRLLDGPAGAVDGSVAEHVAACPECGSLQLAGRRLQDGLRLVSAPQPPRDFVERVVASIIADRLGRRQSRRRWFAAAALAASLLLAILAGYRWLGLGETNRVQPGPIANGSTPTRETPMPGPSPRDSVSGAGEAVASLSRKATEETVEQTRLLWPVATAPLSFDGIDIQTPLEPPAQSLREAGQNVSSGLEPVATSARRAMNLFIRDLPPVEPGKKQRS
jgi:hypothetical protein